jgi:hypothetical protein
MCGSGSVWVRCSFRPLAVAWDQATQREMKQIGEELAVPVVQRAYGGTREPTPCVG